VWAWPCQALAFLPAPLWLKSLTAPPCASARTSPRTTLSSSDIR